MLDPNRILINFSTIAIYTNNELVMFYAIPPDYKICLEDSLFEAMQESVPINASN